MFFKIFIFLFCSLLSSLTNTFIVKNNSGKKIAIFFHKIGQVYPSQYSTYDPHFLTIREDGKTGLENTQEPTCIIVEPGQAEIKFEQDADRLIIMDHELAIKHKMFNNRENIQFVGGRGSKLCYFKSEVVDLHDRANKELEKSLTILEVTSKKEPFGNDGTIKESLSYRMYNALEEDDDSNLMKFLHALTNLCVIL